MLLSLYGPQEGPGTPILGPILGAKSPVCPHVWAMLLSQYRPLGPGAGAPGLGANPRMSYGEIGPWALGPGVWGLAPSQPFLRG